MQRKFSKGEIVQLNSGGPNMTVVSCDSENVEVEGPHRKPFQFSAFAPQRLMLRRRNDFSNRPNVIPASVFRVLRKR